MNVQVHVHVNGDEACEQFLRCYEKAVEITGHGTELKTSNGSLPSFKI